MNGRDKTKNWYRCLSLKILGTGKKCTFCPPTDSSKCTIFSATPPHFFSSSRFRVLLSLFNLYSLCIFCFFLLQNPDGFAFNRIQVVKLKGCSKVLLDFIDEDFRVGIYSCFAHCIDNGHYRRSYKFIYFLLLFF